MYQQRLDLRELENKSRYRRIREGIDWNLYSEIGGGFVIFDLNNDQAIILDSDNLFEFEELLTLIKKMLIGKKITEMKH